MRSERAGFTLVELIVALAIMGIALGISALAAGTWSSPSGDRGSRSRMARATALRDVSLRVVRLDSARTTLLLMPDGRVLGDTTHVGREER